MSGSWVRYHRWLFVAAIALLILAISDFAEAFQVCWTAPTETVTGEPLEGDNALAYFRAYYGRDGAGQWERTRVIEQTGSGCENIRASRGIWYVALTAVNLKNEESALSNWVRKEENRLAGPRDGRLIGPTNGRLLD